MAGRLLDWTPLGLHSDPVPGNRDVLVGVEQDFRRMSDGAGEVNVGLEAVLRCAENGGFRGATAEALRDEISGRLTRFITHVAASFDIAASAVSRYRAAVQSAQDATLTALDTARGLAPNDPQASVLRDQVLERREWLTAEARGLEQSLHDAAGMVSQPIKVKSKLLAILETTLLVGAAALAVVSMFTGGWIALAAFAVDAAMLANTAVDFAEGGARVWELALSGVGVLFPSTNGLGFGWLRSAIQGALHGGSSVLRGIGSGALATGRTALSPTALTGLAKQSVTVLPELIVGAGSTAFRTIRSVPGVIGRTTAPVPSLIDSAAGFVKGTWNAGLTAVHGDFAQVTAAADGMASKLGTYTVVNTGRAFDLSVAAVTPLQHSEIASLGYGGAFHMAFVERGLNMMSVGGAGVTGAGAHTALVGLDLTERGAGARMVEAAAPYGLLAPAAGLATRQGLGAVPDLGSIRGLGAVRAGTEQGLGVGQSRTALPDDLAARLSQSGRSAPLEPTNAGKTGRTIDLVNSGTRADCWSPPTTPPGHAPQTTPGCPESTIPTCGASSNGDFQAVTGADDALAVRVGDAAGAPTTADPTPTSRVSGGAAGEVRVGAADARASLSPTARIDARNSALGLLAGGRTGSGDAAGTGGGVGDGIGTVAESVPVAGRAGGQEAPESEGAPSAAVAGRPDALDAAGLDTAGRAASSSSSSGFTPVGLHEAARLAAPGGWERLQASTARQTVAHGLDTAAGPVSPAASQAARPSRISAADSVAETAHPHAPTAVEPAPSAVPAPAARLEERLTSHTSALDSGFDAALARSRQDDLVGDTYLSDAEAVEAPHAAVADGDSWWAGARYAGAVGSAVRIGATATSACGTVVSVSLPAGDTPDDCPPVSPLPPEQDLRPAPPGQLGNCPARRSGGRSAR